MAIIWAVVHARPSNLGPWRGPALGGPGRYLFCVTRVPGRITRPYNVPNDCFLAPSASFIKSQRQVVGANVNWLLTSLESAQSAT